MARAKQKIAVIGLGQFGMEIARTLAAEGVEVLALDNDMNHIESIKDDVAYAVQVDATDLRALKAQNIHEMDAVIVAIGEDFESLLLCVMNLVDLGIRTERIMARAANSQQESILQKLGISNILSPEREVAKKISESLLNPGVSVRLSLPDDYEIVEITPPETIINKKLSDVGLRERYNLNLITIKRRYEEQNQSNEPMIIEHIIGVPSPGTVIYEGDVLIIMGKREDIKRFIRLN